MITIQSTHILLYFVLLEPNMPPRYLIYRTAPESLVWDIPMFARENASCLTEDVRTIIREKLRITTFGTIATTNYQRRFPFYLTMTETPVAANYAEAVYVAVPPSELLNQTIASLYPWHAWAAVIDSVAKLRHHEYVEGMLITDQCIRQTWQLQW